VHIKVALIFKTSPERETEFLQVPIGADKKKKKQLENLYSPWKNGEELGKEGKACTLIIKGRAVFIRKEEKD